MKIKITDEQILSIGVVEAAINDGYWQDAALKDVQRVYLQGLLDATKSMYIAYIPTGTPNARAVKKRIKNIKELLEKL